jgi:hypothetical protein
MDLVQWALVDEEELLSRSQITSVQETAVDLIVLYFVCSRREGKSEAHQ